MPAPIPLWRRLLYTGVVFVAFLLLAEAALAVVGWTARREWRSAPGGALQVVTLGDSVTAGYGVQPEDAWPGRLAGQDITVTNRARMGQELRALAIRQRARVPDPAKPTVFLVMIGANDFLKWPAGTFNPFFDSAENPLLDAPAASWQPRLLRAARWGRYAVAPEPPAVAASDKQIALYTQRLALLDQIVSEQGAALMLMTYIVPGEPGADLSPAQAASVATTREALLLTNSIIRDVAEQQGVAVLDAARLLPAPATWSRAWFVDNIHLTEAAHARLADAVARELHEQASSE